LNQDSSSNDQFDKYASSYREALDCGLQLSGEASDYFAKQRVMMLKQRLDQLGAKIGSILDFGCGIGTTIPLLQARFGTEHVVGFDSSKNSLAVARKLFPEVNFYDSVTLPVEDSFDLIYTNGVFHHIAREEQASRFQFIADRLTKPGYFALWENNPFSPAARWVMSRIPFDKDAEMVWPAHARALAVDVNLSVISTWYEFIFPRMFSSLRFLENYLNSFPLGAQYLMLATKPV